MFVGSKWIRMITTQTLVALLLLQVLIGCTEAATKCHKCTGINCQRTSYTATEDCVDALDSCTTIFQGSTVLAQGCLGQLAVELRNKCETPTNTNEDNEVAMEGEKLQTANAACYQCREDLCNEVSGEAFECIQCDSNADGECASGTGNLQPAKCPIGRSMNSYCYTKVEGKRAIRGCATNLVEQKECLNSNDCVLCSPLDISGCNRDPKISTDGTGSGSESGGSDNGTGTGDGGSSSGGGGGNGGGSGTGDGGSSSGGGGGNGSGSGTGDDGSNSGGGSGNNSGTNNGTGSGTGDGGSSSGGGGGNNSGSNNGTGSGTGDGGSSSGGGGGNNSGSNNGTGSGTGDGGSNSGNGGSGTGSGGSDNGTGSGNDTTDSGNNNTSGATLISNYKLLTTVIFILLALFKF
ncbi:uncharacterized protein LOC129245417 [Anastrepha obliqua]|uniref:uncharacterized protein LOC129245417 n=1 Tax=Anastrepha obliqua TaxID=95512 RepID=UPI00240A8F2D|nr:uncharacterized protein LOC129245417 [Anastrepha obliqua]